VLAAAYEAAKLTQGVLDRAICRVAAAILVATGALLWLIGKAWTEPSRGPVPFFHCFVTIVIWGGVAMAVLTELHCLLHWSRCARFVLVVALLVSSVTAYLLYVFLMGDNSMLNDVGEDDVAEPGSQPTYEIYPVVVWFVSFRVVPMLGVSTFFLVSAATWGITFKDAPGSPAVGGVRAARSCCLRRQTPGGGSPRDAVD